MPRQFHIAFNLFVIAVGIFISVDIFYKIVRIGLYNNESRKVQTSSGKIDEAKMVSSAGGYQIIIERNLFGATGQAKPAPSSVELTNLEPTTLQVRLLGTIAGDEQNARAIIEDTQKKRQNLYRVGDAIQGAVINLILRGKVVLRVNDHDEILTMEEEDNAAKPTAATAARKSRRTRSGGAAAERTSRTAQDDSSSPAEENSLTLSQSEIAESLNNISDILTQVRVEPYMVEGTAQGLVVNDIASGSIFDRMGLTNGDIVQAVNRKQITSPDDIVVLYQSLKSAKQLDLQVTRDGQQHTLNYNIR
jgi:general secretion pathway protein C